MIIKTSGEMTLQQMGDLLNEVIGDIVNRAGLDVTAGDVTFKDLEVGIIFNINGSKQYLTVNPAGVEEIFKVYVQLDENGKIKKAVDNEEKTFLDDYSLAVAKGEELEYEEIESVYDDVDLEVINEKDGGDIEEITYDNLKTGEKVIRYYKNGVLVGEMGMLPKEENAE